MNPLTRNRIENALRKLEFERASVGTILTAELRELLDALDESARWAEQVRDDAAEAAKKAGYAEGYQHGKAER